MARIAVTMGDPAGIGPEICLRLLHHAATQRDYVPVIFGDAGVLQRVAQQCQLDAPRRILSREEWNRGILVDKPSVLDLCAIHADDVTPGRISASSGAASYAYVDEAIRAAIADEVDAISTGPINKEALHMAGYKYPGHTEIFAARTKA